ncbi:MAG: discoidin domain-containing protein, partial [Planctomycetota bacterium]|nr:discoidin domain-containing protein [Planctomycetota bacterium]
QEIVTWGLTNHLSNSKASASSTSEEKYSAAKAIDGSLKTRSASTARKFPQWPQFEFNQEVEVDTLVLIGVNMGKQMGQIYCLFVCLVGLLVNYHLNHETTYLNDK